MENYEYNSNIYLLPLKINTTKSNIARTYIGGIFLFITFPLFLLSFLVIEKCIDKGFDFFSISLIVTTFIISLISLIIILPRQLTIDSEKIKLKCLVYKKEIYWADMTSLATNISDVAFATRDSVWEKDRNLIMHKANQTVPGVRIGIKKVELVFRKKNDKMGTFKFFIPTDSQMNFEALTKTISHTYKHAKMKIPLD